MIAGTSCKKSAALARLRAASPRPLTVAVRIPNFRNPGIPPNIGDSLADALPIRFDPSKLIGRNARISGNNEFAL